jgi:hypothetical protein
MSTIKAENLAKGANSTDMDNAIFGTAKAWVNWNGTGTVAIRNSYNVSSITDNTTGTYTVNFTTALPDADYSMTTMCRRGATNEDLIPRLPVGSTYSTTACQVEFRTSGRTLVDADIGTMTIHGN